MKKITLLGVWLALFSATSVVPVNFLILARMLLPESSKHYGFVLFACQAQLLVAMIVAFLIAVFFRRVLVVGYGYEKANELIYLAIVTDFIFYVLAMFNIMQFSVFLLIPAGIVQVALAARLYPLRHDRVAALVMACMFFSGILTIFGLGITVKSFATMAVHLSLALFFFTHYRKDEIAPPTAAAAPAPITCSGSTDSSP